jgi:hypothetical protein
MNEQVDEGPAEDIAALLQAAGYPAQALISIGATRYTPFGETNFLKVGDTSVVVLYPADRYDAATITQRVADGELEGDGLSVLVQQVI